MIDVARARTITEKIAEIELAYYRQADFYVFRAQEMLDWYSMLSQEERHQILLIPIARWKLIPSLRRYILEKRGHKMQIYMMLYLSPSELVYWMDNVIRQDGLLAPAF